MISHPLSNPVRIQSIELSYLHIMPRSAKTKKKPSEKEASADGDGFEAFLSVGVGESNSLNMQKKSPTMARTNLMFQGQRRRLLRLQLPHQRSLPAQRLVEEMPT
jgi:hypothetical protein